MGTYSEFYRRNLPHWQPGATDYFITFRLANTLPQTKIYQLRELRFQITKAKKRADKKKLIDIHRKIFDKYEELIDGSSYGPTYLKDPRIGELVSSSIEFREPEHYFIYAYSIMPNHVHMVIRLNEIQVVGDYPLTTVLQSLKGYTGYEANAILNRSGSFWHPESYDRVIRDQPELENKVRYTINNPVKAGLVKFWEEWPYSYCNPVIAESYL